MARLSRAERGLAAMILAYVAIEAALWLADRGLAGPPRLRQLAYDYGGFWPGLLGSWRPNYPGQAWAMFATYGLLHAGPVHLAVNMVTLWSLGRAAIDRVGGPGMAWLYLASMLGGGVGFGLLAPDLRPMVGASGALFGLVGGLLAWTYVDRFTFRERMWPVARAVLVLIGLNVVLWWAMDGQLAWQTHLGGFVAGWIAALLIDPRPREPAEDAPDADPGRVGS